MVEKNVSKPGNDRAWQARNECFWMAMLRAAFLYGLTCNGVLVGNDAAGAEARAYSLGMCVCLRVRGRL